MMTSALADLMCRCASGGSPRNNWVVDAVMGLYMAIVYFFALKIVPRSKRGPRSTGVHRLTRPGVAVELLVVTTA